MFLRARVATSSFFLSIWSASAFTASPPQLLADTKKIRVQRHQLVKSKDPDLPERPNGDQRDTGNEESSSSFSSNIFIVDEDGKDSNNAQKDTTFGSSLLIVDEVDKSGFRRSKEASLDESSAESPHHTDVFISTDDADTRSRSPTTRKIDFLLKYIPIISPIVAYLTYEKTAEVFDFLIETLSERNWYAVDGGQYQTQIITPAVNGIVIPAISILFATLIANTVSALRRRQLDIRTTLNKEAGEIRVLQAMIDSFPESAQEATSINGKDSQDRCRMYLIKYTSRLLAESQPEVEVDNLMFTGSMDSELNGLVVELNKVTTACVGGIPGPILSESYAAVTRLNAERSTRISAIQSTYPLLHYAILGLLASSICMCFVIESDQQLLIFLNAVQLKMLWTMLIGTFSALGVVCYDLGDPFRGYYQITRSLDQLYTIRNALKASDRMKKAEQGSEE